VNTDRFTPSAESVFDALHDALGSGVVQRVEDVGTRAWSDASGSPCVEPSLLLRPGSTSELATAMRICHEFHQPVSVQGGLTGLSGGACPGRGELAVSLERMRGIESIDPVAATMTVLAGTPLEQVQRAADEAGLLFPLDLGARGTCSIGGNLATNAGGNRVIRYGMMRDQTLDVEAVLADGTIVGGLRPMMKNNTGYDLKHLLIGSEGTLAIITRAVLRLRPKPRAISTAFCGLRDYTSVAALLSKAQAALPAGVSAFEVMWPSFYDFYTSRLHELRRPLTGDHGFYVLLESMGADPELETDVFESFLASMFEDGIVEDAALAGSHKDALDFWAIRDAVSENGRLLPDHVAFDISFAAPAIFDAARRCEASLRQRWPDATVLVYGHVGDGNIHVVVQEPSWPASEAHEAQELVYSIVGDMHGSVSAEHGIGMKRRHVLGLTRTPAEIACMRAIKGALDPRGLLNPGRVLG